MRINVLDHGYVELVEVWGRGTANLQYPTSKDYFTPRIDYEVGIIEAARQSTQGGFRGWEPAACDCGYKARLDNADELGKAIHHPACAYTKNPGDARLLSYLYSHKHMTPFEFSGMVLEIQAPIFVFREWHRHRTQSYNEASARYAPLENLNYIPSIERILMDGGVNKQAGTIKGIDPLTDPELAETFQWVLKRHYDDAEKRYQEALQRGVPKELARVVMPVGRYSKMRATANLRNWLQFLTLRLDPAAQWEIRQYAEAVASIIEQTFPQTYRLFAQEYAKTHP